MLSANCPAWGVFHKANLKMLRKCSFKTLSVLKSTNLKNGTLLSYNVLENPLHKTHHWLRKGLLQTPHVIGIHGTHVVDLRRFPLVAYNRSLRLLLLHARDYYVKGYLRWAYECYEGFYEG